MKRLQVARTTGHAPPGLIDATLNTLANCLPAADGRAIRDAYLRQAARLLPGTTWQQASTLAELIRRFHYPADEVRRLLRQAERAADLPTSVRQIHRIISSY
ncbi:MAG TPA: hypothetical protein PKY50_19260 [Candidatus Competibacter sp.]|nr:hypothetical protein [Candidatus Competibacter sp.]